VNIKPKHFRFKKFFFKEILRVGVPSSANQSLMSLGIMALTRIVAYFGPIAIAAYGIGFRLETLVILPVLGISTAVITIVGQNVGANKFERAEKTTFSAAKISFAFVFFIALSFFLFPRTLFSIFSNDPQLIEYGVGFLRYMSPAYLFVSVAIVIASAFQGAGFANPALVMTSIRLFIFAVPLALLFAFVFGFGLIGVWIGAALSTLLTTIISVVWFKLGTWKKETLK